MATFKTNPSGVREKSAPKGGRAIRNTGIKPRMTPEDTDVEPQASASVPDYSVSSVNSRKASEAERKASESGTTRG